MVRKIIVAKLLDDCGDSRRACGPSHELDYCVLHEIHVIAVIRWARKGADLRRNIKYSKNVQAEHMAGGAWPLVAPELGVDGRSMFSS